jgi:serine/threonine protein kinase
VKIIPCKKRHHVNKALKEAAHSAALDAKLVARAILYFVVDPHHLTDDQKQMLHAPNHQPAKMTQEQLETWEQVWLVFEFCSEGDLSHKIDDPATQRLIDELPVDLSDSDDEKSRCDHLQSFELLRWCAQMSRGLDAMKRLGIVHRDIKLDNILMTLNEKGQIVPKIGDFGIVVADFQAQNAAAMGTQGYIAPEILSKHSPMPPSFKSDIYSLGVVFARLFTRQTNQVSSIHQLMHQMIQNKHTRMWAPVVKQMLDADPEKRPSAALLVDMFEGRCSLPPFIPHSETIVWPAD